MGRYTIRRLLQLIPVVIGTTFLIYVAVWALPGDPFAGKCGDKPCPAEYVAQMTEKYNLNDNVIVAYFKYLGQLLQGNLGETFAGRQVIDELARAFPVTLRLALVAIFFEIIIGITAGILAALRRGKFLDNLVLVSTLLVISIPVFVIGYLAQFIFAIKLGWFPPTVGAGASLYDYILPGLVLASLSLAYVARLTRSSLGENLRADYVRTAVAKGVPRGQVVRKHALRNSMIPVVTFIGADFGALLGGAIVTEGIFNIAGFGGLIYQSIRLREGTTVVALVTVLVLIFLLVNLFVDLLYGLIDPRIRYE
ncbi:MAG: oligopeptide transport system permease protein [Actinomycetota bacterium]|nr:oligopeptide transport system permease protein [Actinomycetota bacterium]